LRFCAALFAGVAACLSLAGCGLSSPGTSLPAIDHTRPATMLNAKQKSKALAAMNEIAEKQNQRAAKITPITYKIPETTN